MQSYEPRERYYMGLCGVLRRLLGVTVLRRVVYTGDLELEESEVLNYVFKEKKCFISQNP